MRSTAPVRTLPRGASATSSIGPACPELTETVTEIQTQIQTQTGAAAMGTREKAQAVDRGSWPFSRQPGVGNHRRGVHGATAKSVGGPVIVAQRMLAGVLAPRVCGGRGGTVIAIVVSVRASY